MATTDPLETRLQSIETRLSGMDGRLQSIETRLTGMEVAQKWLSWGVGITLAIVVGNLGVTIAMAMHLLTRKP